MRLCPDNLCWPAALLGGLLGTALAGCGGGAEAATPPTSESHGGEEQTLSTADRTLALHMGNYFWMVLDARDALITGDLSSAKSRMLQMSEQDYRDVVPAAWTSDMQRVVSTAKGVADASDLDEASRALAHVAVHCGACHSKLRAGPLPNPDRQAKEGEEDLTARMMRHRWAADALWSGLTRPADADWRAGARALLAAPTLSSVDAGAGIDFEPVRAIGAAALEASSPEQRAGVYANLLQSCSGCHGKLRPSSATTMQ